MDMILSKLVIISVARFNQRPPRKHSVKTSQVQRDATR